jgi:hypothetical protein
MKSLIIVVAVSSVALASPTTDTGKNVNHTTIKLVGGGLSQATEHLLRSWVAVTEVTCTTVGDVASCVAAGWYTTCERAGDEARCEVGPQRRPPG